MPLKPENENQRIEHGPQGVSPSNVYSQPWWRGIGSNDSPASLNEGTLKSSSMEHLTSESMQSQTNGGLNNGANVNKEAASTIARQSGSDGNRGQENQHLQLVSPSMPATMGEHLEPNSQMELVGHSIVLTSYPYSDPHYGGIMTPYGPQAMVHPHLYGMHHARMPLPLDMEEEPVYVNAKQYHGILRRRQSRAKAELEKKAIKVRKPYLHESRHQHAMRRARGCGGRFLNTKKPDGNTNNSTLDKGTDCGATNSTQSASSSGSEQLPANNFGNLDSLGDQQEGSAVRDMHKAHNFSNGNSNGRGLSSIYHSTAGGSEEAGYLGQQRGSMQVNGAPPRAVPIK
ncbi:hypothetical protein L1049_011341 [Liquidambar formosana]|uniref:Nuclear transcription factor Y subunit n=1 Tax=Liquidambar formosana TaxID=63359 RepID=A0AAP0RRI6_LIQFO